ncbi:hypothetical protein [Ulvibacterium sp.]|uniref:hypothetical protein n=1 Tax=Ulvibacterium sp. TaxID=2665914 RepID=UPI002629F363|nr:hypothetical protein [Ulvibacterium sp.]
MKTFFKLSFFLVIILGCHWSCVQETHLKTVTFKVNMNSMENAQDVGLRGNFTSPPWEITLPMEDRDQDGIYETTVSKSTAQNEVEFKFVNFNNQYELNCSGNRVIIFEYRPETLVYEATFNEMDGRQVPIQQ